METANVVSLITTRLYLLQYRALLVNLGCQLRQFLPVIKERKVFNKFKKKIGMLITCKTNYLSSKNNELNCTQAVSYLLTDCSH